MKRYILAAGLISFTWSIWSFQFSTHASTEAILSARDLSLEERITYQQRVESVYWQHQIWGKENQKTKPSLEEVMPNAVIRAKAEDAVRRSLALEHVWKRPVTPEQLQAEMDRMARDTQNAGLLRELWAALDNDPSLVAEILARPLLADRLIRSSYAHDENIHGEVRRRAQNSLEQHGDRLSEMDGDYAEIELIKVKDGEGLSADRRSKRAISLPPEKWNEAARTYSSTENATSNRGARFHEEETNVSITRVLSNDGERLVLARVSWKKQPFDEWWLSKRNETPTDAIEKSSYVYQLPIITAPASCTDDTWTPTKAIPDPRYNHTAVWTGTEMIVWGGSNIVGNPFNTGGRYNPATDTWTYTSVVNAPSRREYQTAVWTGSEMLIWGGTANAPGGRYNPSTDSWTPIGVSNAPAFRSQHVAVWTGSRMIVWGGGFPSNTNTGGVYDPATDSWAATSLTGAPSGRNIPSYAWTGTEMIVWSGYTGSGFGPGGARYNPNTNSWTPMSTANEPLARYDGAFVWSGTEMIVWGGTSPGPNHGTGGRYNPSTDTWVPTSAVNAPSGRRGHTSVWSGSEMIIWGGNDTSAPQVGGRYNPATDTWQLTTTVNAPRERAALTSVWTGSEMIVWGGLSQELSEFQHTGGRYNPSTDSWSPTNTYNVPDARGNHSAVWTGTEMIIWGGVDFRQKNSGGRYNPATDSWQPTSLINAPIARQNPEAVWTGTEMIIWGGALPEMNTGGRYNPMTDSWRPTSLINAPSARYAHRMVWTGSEMIVWSGEYAGNTGGRYDPVADTWQPTTLTNAPARRDSHTAVWTGTEMLIWGGYPNYDPAVSFGGRYNPTTNTWTAITSTGAPVPRHFHSGVWTGTEMVVWGGQNFDQCFNQSDGVCYYRDGGRYNPATDSWRPTTLTNAPLAHANSTGVWTGEEMIIWGPVTIGGRYNPVTDAWRTMSTVNAPKARNNHTVVWTGTEAIAWGANIPTISGGRYCAQTASAPTSAVSRKTHGTTGTFDINLPLTGNAGVECRSGGVSSDHQIVFTFPSAVTLSGATVTPEPGRSGNVAGPPIITPDGKTVTVNITAVTDVQTITLTLSGVNNGTSTNDVNVLTRLLMGDTNGNGVVNASDVGQTKSRSGQAVSEANFRSDVAVNGAINASDVALVKSRSGQ
jgi:N-acetylneuraminic acid mutarotase